MSTNVLQDIDQKGNKYYIRTATEAEAEAGLSNEVLITPLNLKQGIDALSSRSTNLDGGLSNSVYTTGTEIYGGDASGN